MCYYGIFVYFSWKVDLLVSLRVESIFHPWAKSFLSFSPRFKLSSCKVSARPLASAAQAVEAIMFSSFVALLWQDRVSRLVAGIPTPPAEQNVLNLQLRRQSHHHFLDSNSDCEAISKHQTNCHFNYNYNIIINSPNTTVLNSQSNRKYRLVSTMP